MFFLRLGVGARRALTKVLRYEWDSIQKSRPEGGRYPGATGGPFQRASRRSYSNLSKKDRNEPIPRDIRD